MTNVKDDPWTRTAPIEITIMENGWILAHVWPRAKEGDRIARSLYLKLKAAAIACGVPWDYADDPWPVDAEKKGARVP
jgi:hypothetical protein